MDYDIDSIINARRGAIIAAAGCGKTQAIVKAVSKSPGLQLILTHTHAGVDSLVARFKRLGVSTKKYHVETIASFAMRYTEAYPVLSGLIEHSSENDIWADRYESMFQLLSYSVIHKIIKETYSGMYVDEYQDCSLKQHLICTKLADLIPCRVFGDPLQSIFTFGGQQVVSWDEHVFPSFERLPELNIPWRWYKSNKTLDRELGDWLQTCRKLLISGSPIDLRDAPKDAVSWVEPDSDGFRTIHNHCYRLLKASGSVMVIMDQANQCHSLARNLGGAYQSMEEMDSKDLRYFAAQLMSASRVMRVIAILEFAKRCMTESTAITEIQKAFELQRLEKIKSKYPQLIFILESATNNDTLRDLEISLDAIQTYLKGKIFRRELWSEMKRALIYSAQNNVSLIDSVQTVRNRTRITGRYINPKMISRTLLVKGLEFDHVLISSADKMTKENLYVALTRPTSTLTILTRSPILQGIDIKT